MKPMAAACLLLLLTGCAGSSLKVVDGPNLQVVHQGTLPPPADALTDDGRRISRIGPGDKIAVSVFGQPDLSEDQVQVDVAGNVAVPLVGTVHAAGQTPEQLAARIKGEMMKHNVRDPIIAVNVVEGISQVVTVDGDVTQPGLYPITGDMTLMKAVAEAKGTSEFAKLDDVVILRQVGDQRMAGLYSLAAVRNGAYADPQVYPGDTIVVGDSPAKRSFDRFLTLGSILVSPVVAVLRR